jgi:hypothetical protein
MQLTDLHSTIVNASQHSQLLLENIDTTSIYDDVKDDEQLKQKLSDMGREYRLDLDPDGMTYVHVMTTAAIGRHACSSIFKSHLYIDRLVIMWYNSDLRSIGSTLNNNPYEIIVEFF